LAKSDLWNMLWHAAYNIEQFEHITVMENSFLAPASALSSS